ncbi:hypothetical protein A6V25_31820 [Nostoc sp. ATCC 53789]|nr:hypothetical protein A6V25_31820 [Nostoc sp. ATCC 53789]
MPIRFSLFKVQDRNGTLDIGKSIIHKALQLPHVSISKDLAQGSRTGIVSMTRARNMKGFGFNTTIFYFK